MSASAFYLSLYHMSCSHWETPLYTYEQMRVKKLNIIITEVVEILQNSPEKVLGIPRVPWCLAISK